MLDQSDLRVMIVEDQALLALELEYVLGEAGCSVVGSAMDQASALDIAERERPNLALIDINLLDGMSGPEIAERMVKDYGATVVFMTANPEQIPEGYAGAIGAVPKPFDEQTIKATVDFARQFMVTQILGDVPRRFQLAPWLASSLGRQAGSNEPA